MYLRYIELFDMELFIRKKMDLALNNQKMLVCHKTKTIQPIR